MSVMPWDFIIDNVNVILMSGHFKLLHPPWGILSCSIIPPTPEGSLQSLTVSPRKISPFFWPWYVACGILVLGSGIEPRAPCIKRQMLKHWTTREVSIYPFKKVDQQNSKWFKKKKRMQWIHMAHLSPRRLSSLVDICELMAFPEGRPGPSTKLLYM